MWASGAARYRAARPETAAVLRAVSSAPSSTARGTPLGASNTTYNPFTTGFDVPSFAGVSVISFTPTAEASHEGIMSRVPVSVASRLRCGVDSGSRSRKAASSASIVSGMGRASRTAPPPIARNATYSSPRYASRIIGLANRACAVSARTTWPVWIT